MKYLVFTLLGLSLLLSVNTKAELVPASTPTTKNIVEEKRAQVLWARLNEIKEMDASNMTASEKRSMRKEVRSINSELKTLGDGVYLSVGAIIIIILLLILLL
ncbi:MAG: hypothetical protein IPP51_05550 [Bacteroidetes bacterium]|nr:hypothetical protein [Bacteroidota bacterium]